MKHKKTIWITWLLALVLLMMSTGCLPQLLEGVMTPLLPLGKNPLQRSVVEVTLTSEQLRNEYVIEPSCEGFLHAEHTHLRYFSSGTFSSQLWFDNPLKAIFAEIVHLTDDQAFVFFRKYYLPRTTIISGRSDFDAKCYHDGGMYPELDEYYCRGGGGLDFDFEEEQVCVFLFDDQANDRIVVSGRRCEGSYFFAGCDKDCKEPGDWTTPETIVASFDAGELLVIPAEQFYAGTTINETFEFPGTCGSYHTFTLTLTTENPDP